MIKLLSLRTYFSPEHAASFYLSENLSEAYADNGIYELVYVPTPSRGIDANTRKKYNKIKEEVLYNGNLELHRYPLFGEKSNPILKGIRYVYMTVVKVYILLFNKNAKCCDVLYLSSTPPLNGIVGGIAKKVAKIPFVYNLQDIFPDSLVNTGLAKKGGLLWKIGRVIENFTYRNADKIIVISEDFKRNIMAKGVPEDKIVVIYNWVDQNAVVDIPRSENKLFDKYGLDRSKFYVTYNGNIGLSQNMELLLQVAKELSNEREQLSIETNSSTRITNEGMVRDEGLEVRDEGLEVRDEGLEVRDEGLEVRDEGLEVRDESVESKVYSVESKEDIRFVLVGEGAYKATLIEKLTETFGEAKKINEDGALQCGPFYLLPFQPYEDISHVFSLGDVSLVISKPGTGAASVPSKTWSIMSASRPVLANFDENELKEILDGNSGESIVYSGEDKVKKVKIVKNGEEWLEVRENDYLQSKARGIFTKAGDKEAFKEAILTLYHNPDLCKQLGKNGRQFVMDNLTKEVGTRKYVEVISAVAERKG